MGHDPIDFRGAKCPICKTWVNHGGAGHTVVECSVAKYGEPKKLAEDRDRYKAALVKLAVAVDAYWQKHYVENGYAGGPKYVERFEEAVKTARTLVSTLVKPGDV